LAVGKTRRVFSNPAGLVNDLSGIFFLKGRKNKKRNKNQPFEFLPT